MKDLDVSFLIPARNEKYLENTIRDILAKCKSNFEILVNLDGYLPEPQIITNDSRVRFFHEPVSIGQRQGINKLAREARGKYLCKIDAHCMVDEGFDVKMMADYKEGEVHIGRMYNLDVYNWTPKFHKKTDYMYIGMNEKGQLRSLYYSGKEWKKWHSREQLIDETMGCMGPCRFMSAETFWKLGGCDERHGSWGSEGIEWACKAWLSGGKMIVNKKTWFAHWFRGSDGGFPYPISGNAVDRARKHAEDLWFNNKWEGQVRPFQWLLAKFQPPSWTERDIYGPYKWKGKRYKIKKK